MSKKPTAAQKKRWDMVVDLGCLITGGPAELHHCRHECGMGQRNHDHVAPLSPELHRTGSLSRHGQGSREFQEKYPDRWMHDETCRILGET